MLTPWIQKSHFENHRSKSDLLNPGVLAMVIFRIWRKCPELLSWWKLSSPSCSAWTRKRVDLIASSNHVTTTRHKSSQGTNRWTAEQRRKNPDPWRNHWAPESPSPGAWPTSEPPLKLNNSFSYCVSWFERGFLLLANKNTLAGTPGKNHALI